jgi:hypothetical protein
MNNNISKHLVAIAALACAGGAWGGEGTNTTLVVKANTPTVAPVIKSMEINPVKAKSSETVTVTVNGSGTCKFHVDFGNGLSTDKVEVLPVSFPASFIVASYETSVFTVTATGQAGCQGSAQASVTVGEPVPAQTTTTLKIKVNPTLFSTTTTTAIKICPPGKRC